MRRVLPLLASLALLASPAFAQDLIAKTDPLKPQDELKGFTVPAGFSVQLVAAEPDIEKPMQMAWDGKGRLWVTTSHTYPFPAAAGKESDKLFVLSDFDEHGKAKTVKVFSDKLNIPIGVLPLPDGKSVIVSEVGKIVKLTDTDGDGKADKKEELFGGFGFRDTHGMTNSYTLLPDGWVYACHGFSNESKTKGADGSELAMQSGNTFRFRPDGSHVEAYTRGQVNPFGMCVDPWLNLYTADCHSKPMTQLVRGAHYDSFGKPHDGLGYAPHMFNHQHGSTGLCGLVYYAADQYPAEWNGVMFVGNVVTNRINCDRVEWHGSTPVGKELPDFLASADPWFRPTDIKLGPDGALYVTDFYNKIVGHYEVDLNHPGRDKTRGRVWRIVWTGKDGKAAAPTMPRADWSKATDAELFADFGHSNTTVRLLAANEAATRAKFDGGSDLMERVGSGIIADPVRTVAQIGMAMLVVERIGVEKGGYAQLIKNGRDAKLKPEAYGGLLVKALTSRAEWGGDERKQALDCLELFDSVRVRRAAVDGMTAHPHADFVPPLLALLPKVPADDVLLRHAARIALRNCIDQPGGWKAGVENVGNDATPLVDVALGSTNRDVIAGLSALHTANKVPDAKLFEVGHRIGRYGEPVQWAAFCGGHGVSIKSVESVLGIVRGSQESGKPLSGDDGRDYLHAVRDVADAAVVNEKGVPGLTEKGAELFRELRKQSPPTASLATLKTPAFLNADAKATPAQKLAAAEVAVLFGTEKDRDLVRPMLADAGLDAATRERLMLTLLANKPTAADFVAVVALVKTSPYSLAQKLAVGLTADAAGSDLLLDAVKKGDAPARLLQEKPVVDRLRAAKVKDLDARLKELTKGIPPADKRIEDLLKARAAGFTKAKPDAAKGKEVFAKNCAICHQLNNEGAKVGPQLDGVGIRGLERLVEDTLDPSRNVDQAFRATKLDLKNGQSVSGLLLREEGAVYVIADAQGKEQRVAVTDVDSKTTSNLSAMPNNIDTVVTEADYYHLLAYLLSQRPKK